MIKLDANLLENYFLLQNNHNVQTVFLDTSDVYIELSELHIYLDYLNIIIEKKKIYEGIYEVNNKDDLIKYIFEFLYHSFKVYENSFRNKKQFELFIITAVSLFLTKFATNAFDLLESYLNLSVFDEGFSVKIKSYLSSCDPRGLLFYLCKKNNLPYDLIAQDDVISYQYTEPAINKTWQKQYRKDNTPIVFWFYESLIGKALFLILYTPKCRYKVLKGGCSGCNLPTVSAVSNKLNSDDVIKQINYTFNDALSANEKNSLIELMLSNNGSILDPKTMTLESLKHAVNIALQELPCLKKIIFETRIDDYTDMLQLEIIKEIVEKTPTGVKLEVAVGFEIFDDKLRNGYYKKGLEKKVLEEKMLVLAELGVSIKIYMMYKAVPDNLMSVDDAIQDINNASEYFSKFVDMHNLKLNLHISPTYLAPGTALFKEHQNNKYNPPSYTDIERMYNLLNIKDNLSYYISMNNEGLGDSNIDMDYRDQLLLREKISKFNISNYK